MFGFNIGDFLLVEAAWNSIDGIWFLIFAGLFILFCVKDKLGKYPLSAFVLILISLQYLSHWHYTIFGATEEQIIRYNDFYANTFFVIPISENRIIPDFYHIMLHSFILFAFICMMLYCIKSRKIKSE